jgi:hypothetical protein
MNQKALYYPYIHIHDVSWLKATLLLFSELRRMLPMDFMPSDSQEVRAFAETSDTHPALLTAANLWTSRAINAQEVLARRLMEDACDGTFRSTHDIYATRQLMKPNDPGFQIHQMKLAEPLKEALRCTGLAWVPYNPEPYFYAGEYVEMNPRIGEAVMSTLAVAAATGEGLDIVGDRRSGELHNCLLEKKAEEIYNAWLHPPALQPAPGQPGGEDLFEFLVGLPCDLSGVTPESLAALDREPLRKLITRLREIASNIPAMDAGPEREGYFNDAASKVLQEWRSDRSNLSNYWRTFFGQGKIDGSQKFVEKVADKLTSGTEKAAGGLVGAAASAGGGGIAGAAAGGGTAAMAGAGAAAMATAAVASAGVGLAIGVVFHAVRSYSRMRENEENSPYRFLTLMEEAGVVFRSDLGIAKRWVPKKPKSMWGRVKGLFGT